MKKEKNQKENKEVAEKKQDHEQNTRHEPGYKSKHKTSESKDYPWETKRQNEDEKQTDKN